MADIEADRLDSWKDIAQYLKRDVRTVIRYEKERNLPVHRIPGGGGVYAYPHELEAWLRAGAKTVRAPGRRPQSLRSLPLYAVWAVLALLVLGWWSWRTFRVSPRLDRVSVRGRQVHGWDAKGAELWHYAFPDSMQPFPDQLRPWDVRMADLNGDGQPEVLVVAARQGPDGLPGPEGVYCFSPTGKLLWRFEPNETLQFGGRTYEGPWKVTEVLPPTGTSLTAVWVAFAHHTWWPSFLVKLDAAGLGQLMFVNSGVIYRLAHGFDGVRHFVVAGGVNNEYASGILAAVQDDQIPGTSPQSEAQYRCDSCPAGHPAWYAVLPRSELNELASAAPYNPVMGLKPFQNSIQASTAEANGVETVYEFSAQFKLRAVSVSDGFAALHRKFEKQGQLGHTLKECPELARPKRIRTWSEATGWRDVVGSWANTPSTDDALPH